MTLALVVDDDQTWSRLALAAFQLAAPHVSVHFTASAVSALDQMAADVLPDLVVVDLHMPGVGGLDFLRCLRDAGVTSTRVVLMSSLLTGADRAAALQLGASSCLDKPASFSALVEVLAELVSETESSVRS